MGNRATDRLVAALRAAGAPPDLVIRAAGDAFHDFKSDSPTPIVDLVRECERRGLTELAQRAKGGEFDADKLEADEWLASPEGQRAMRALTGDARDA